MKRIFIAILFILINSSFAIANDESEEIIVYIKQKSIVPIKNPKNFVLVTSNIVEAEKDQDEYITLEGKSYGETMMYIWEQNDNIRIFRIKTVSQKSMERLSQNSYQINKDINYNFSYGLNSFSLFSDRGNTQNIGSFINYFYKINDDEKVNFRANLNSNIADFSNFKDLSFQNINLEYKSKNWLVGLGDNGSISNTNLLNFNNVFVRGFRLSNKFENNEFEFSSGLEYQPILFSFLSTENKVSDKYIYNKYSFTKDSFIEGKFISSVDTKNNYNLSNNLTLSALNKTDDYSIVGAVDTNFSSLNVALNSSYVKRWDSTKEWIEPSLFFSRISRLI